jgi:transketolase
MQSLHYIRGFAEDPQWPDRDRVLAAPGAPAFGGHLAVSQAGPPGLSFGVALGLALAERLLAARFGRSLVDHRTWLIAGPDELASGTSHESAAIAGALALGRLTVTAFLPAAEGPALARFTAVGWTVRRVIDGDLAELEAALSAAMRAQKPTLIAVLHRSEAPPAGGIELAASAQSAGARRAWLKRVRRHAAGSAFQQAMAATPPPRLPGAMTPPDSASEATPLEAVHEVLARLAPAMPDLMTLPSPAGAAAGLAGALWAGRQQAQSAALLGMAMHGGVLPLGWFPPEAADALVPARRQAAMQDLRLIQAITAGALPMDAATSGGAPVFRPCGAAEALECTALALRWPGPTVLVLHADSAAAVKSTPGGACAKGAYRLEGAPDADCALVAAGDEVALALRVRAALASHGLEAAVISLPCQHLFATQDEAWRQSVIGQAPRFGLGRIPLVPGCIMLDVRESPDATYLAARIEHRLRRSPDILEASACLLESASKLD